MLLFELASLSTTDSVCPVGLSKQTGPRTLCLVTVTKMEHCEYNLAQLIVNQYLDDDSHELVDVMCLRCSHNSIRRSSMAVSSRHGNRHSRRLVISHLSHTVLLLARYIPTSSLAVSRQLHQAHSRRTTSPLLTNDLQV